MSLTAQDTDLWFAFGVTLEQVSASSPYRDFDLRPPVQVDFPKTIAIHPLVVVFVLALISQLVRSRSHVQVPSAGLKPMESVLIKSSVVPDRCSSSARALGIVVGNKFCEARRLLRR